MATAHDEFSKAVAGAFSLEDVPFDAGIKICGRDAEQAQLKSCVDRVVNEKRQEWVILAGGPGSGKTTMLYSMKTDALPDCVASMVTLDIAEARQSYATFQRALGSYTKAVSSDERKSSIIAALEKALDSDQIDEIIDVFPDSKSLFPKHETRSKKKVDQRASKNTYRGGETLVKFRAAISTFVGGLCGVAPWILLLDDVQFADRDSLDLIKYLMITQRMGLLIVSSYRSGDVDSGPLPEDSSVEEFPFHETLRELEAESQNALVQRIVLPNFSKESAKDLFTTLLRRNDVDVPLETVVELTNGNPFYGLIVIRFLLDQGLINESDQAEGWSWDTAVLRKMQKKKYSVIDILGKLLAGLPRGTRETLKIAACMGDRIIEHALDGALQTKSRPYLHKAASKGLLRFVQDGGYYVFPHCWIRQTAEKLIPSAEREEFHANLGTRLWKSASEASLEQDLTSITSILNIGSKVIDDETRLGIAELNLRAAEKASSDAQFPEAAKFCRKGILMLGSMPWEDNYPLVLSLYSLGAEVEVANGNTARVVSYIEKVVAGAKSLEDKLRAYKALLKAMALENQLEEAAKTGLDVLNQLGESIPEKISRILLTREVSKVGLLLRKMENEEIMGLPVMENEKQILSLDMLCVVFMVCFNAKSSLTPFLACRGVRRTIKYGLHPAAAPAFAMYGMALCALGLDCEAGYRFGRLSMALAESNPKHSYLPVVNYLNGLGISYWSDSITRTALKELSLARQRGSDLGQVDVALWAGSCHATYSLFSGQNIEIVKEEVLRNIRIARFHRYQLVASSQSALLQLIHCYQGRAKNPCRLSGTAIDFVESLRDAKDKNDVNQEGALYLYSMQIAYMFGDFSYAALMADHASRMDIFPSAEFTVPQQAFIEALARVALIKKKVDCKKNEKIAKHLLKELSNYARASPQCYHHKKTLLKAEIASLRGEKSKVEAEALALYSDSITEASKGGFIHDLALSYECAGNFKLNCGDNVGAQELIEKAMNAYRDWGATYKVSLLQGSLKAS